MNKPDVINETKEEWLTIGSSDVIIMQLKDNNNGKETTIEKEISSVVESLRGCDKMTTKFENRQVPDLLTALHSHLAEDEVEITICHALLDLSFHDVIDAMKVHGIQQIADLIRADSSAQLKHSAVQLLYKLSREHLQMTSSIVEAAVEPIYLHVINAYAEQLDVVTASNDEDTTLSETFATSVALVHHLARCSHSMQRHRVLMQPDLINDIICVIHANIDIDRDTGGSQTPTVRMSPAVRDCVGFLAALTGHMRDVMVTSQKLMMSVRRGSVVRRRKQSSSYLSALKQKSFAKPVQEGCDILKDSKMVTMCCGLLHELDAADTGEGVRYITEIVMNLSCGEELWSDAARVVLGKEKNLSVIVRLLSNETLVRDAVTILGYLNRAVTNQRFIGKTAMRELVDLLLLGDHRVLSCATVVKVLETIEELLDSRSEENAKIFVQSCGVHVVKFLTIHNAHMDYEKVREMAKRLLASLWRNYCELLSQQGYFDSNYFLKSPTKLVKLR